MKAIKFLGVLLLTAVIASCASTPAVEETTEDVSSSMKQNLTDVGIIDDDKDSDYIIELYSVRLFSDVTEVSSYNKSTKETIKKFSPDEYSYDKNTGEVELKTSATHSKNTAYRILGVAKHPDSFVLAGYDKKEPGVFLDGKLVKDGDAYTFDAANALVTFNSDIDIEEHTYTIVWLTDKGMSSYSDGSDNDKSIYEKLIAEWSGTQLKGN